jgi:predicted phage tail component-like protein
MVLPSLPEITRQTIAVPKKIGTVDFGTDTYQEKQISVSLKGIYDTPALAVAASETISAWLYNDGTYRDLIFDYAPDRVYKAKVTSAVNAQIGKSVTFQISFVCNPPFPYVNGILLTPEEILWTTADLDGNQYIQSFSADGSMRFVVSGNSNIKPKITLLNYIKSGLLLEYGTQEWQYDGDIIYDGIVIDCENETVTRLSDGSNLYSNVNESKDNYFELEAGQAEIAISGVTGAYPNNLVVIIEVNGVVV